MIISRFPSRHPVLYICQDPAPKTKKQSIQRPIVAASLAWAFLWRPRAELGLRWRVVLDLLFGLGLGVGHDFPLDLAKVL